MARCGAQAPSFTDVPTSSPFFGTIEWMTTLGIADGFADGTFKPGNEVKRQQMANITHAFTVSPGVGPN